MIFVSHTWVIEISLLSYHHRKKHMSKHCKENKEIKKMSDKVQCKQGNTAYSWVWESKFLWNAACMACNHQFIWPDLQKKQCLP